MNIQLLTKKIERLSENILTLDNKSENVSYILDESSNRVDHIKNVKQKEFQFYSQKNCTQSNHHKKITSDALLNQTQLLESVVINEGNKFSNQISKSLKSDFVSLSQFIKENDPIKDNKSDSKLPKEDHSSLINNIKTNGEIRNVYQKNSIKRPLSSPQITSSAKLNKIDDSKNEFNDIDLSDTQICKIFTEVETKYKMKNDSSGDSLGNEIKNSKSRRQLCFNDCFQENKNTTDQENNNTTENLLNESKDMFLENDNELFPESLNFFNHFEKLEEDNEEVNDCNKPPYTKRAISFNKDSKNQLDQDHQEIKFPNQISDSTHQLTGANFKLNISENNFEKFNNKDIPQNIKELRGFTSKVDSPESSLRKAKHIVVEKTNETPKSNNFSGFTIASEKNLIISENKCIKARKLFNDLNNESLKTDKEQTGFSTASGKKVVFSEKSLQKARQILAETDNETHKSTNMSKFVSTSGKSNTESVGFSTVSGKKVDFSEKSLQKARHILAETDNETPKSTRFVSTSGKSNTESLGFSTASGKKVVFSDKSLQKARQIFAEASNETPKSSNIISYNETPKSAKEPVGFSTASGKKVVFSEKSLQKARQILAETDNETPKSTNMSRFVSTTGKSNTESMGFSTASGKKVVFSDKSLQKARQIFAEASNETPKSSNIISYNETPKSDKEPVGFTTASGKKMVFSEKNLYKARQIFAETENETPNSSSASEKKLNMSENNFRKANKIFEQINDGDEILKFKKQQTGFSTASGKKVDFSERSLQKARQIFAETTNETPKSGFTTVEKKFDISENNRISAKRLFGDMDNGTPKTDKNQGGFSTASGKKVLVTEKSLQKARQIFVESSDETPKSTTACRFETSSENKLNINENVLIKSMKRFEQNDNANETRKPGKEGFSPSIRCQEPFPESTYETPKSSYNSEKKFGISRRNSKDEQNFYNENLQDLFEDDISDSDFCEALKKSEKKDIHVNDNEQTPLTSQMKQNKSFGIANSLDNEVSEITAAFMQDEFKESTMKWTVPVISEPEMILDRHSGVAPPYVSKSNSPTSNGSTSPILNSFDRMGKNKERLAKIKSMLSNSTKGNNLPAGCSTSNFKVPYKTNETGEILPPSNNSIEIKTYEFKNIFHKENVEDNQMKSTKLPTMDEVKEGREQARKLQCREISLSRRKASSIKPLPGSWYLRKINQFENHKSWKEITLGEQPAKHSYEKLIELGVRKNVIKVTSENAIDFRFKLNDYYSESTCTYNMDGIEVGDGSKLVPALDGTAGLEEISLAFLSSPGISPSLVPDDWIKNHYRWLVWKLSAMERSFPYHFGTRALTPNHILLQLKYRYDREIDKAERPALRKILERDDSANKRMILCVASIKKLEFNQSSNTSLQNTSLQFQNSGLYELELTDGWYSVWATIDSAMNSLISREKIIVGTKLLFHGAELSGAQQGCMPLETEANQARLRLSTNSTRRARWDSKLGFCQNPGPFLISLSSLIPQGGIIGRVRIVILRVYPLLFVEKFPDGRSVTRSERAEKQEAANFERKRQSSLEDAYAKARAELETSENEPPKKAQKLNPDKVAILSAGEDLCYAIESASDPSSYQKMLSSQQMRALESYREEKQVKLFENIELKVKEYLEKNKCHVKRNISTLFKVRIMDLYDPLSTRGMLLSIWRPADEMILFLKEGDSFDIYNLSCSRNRDNEIQLSSTRSTRYQPLKLSKQHLVSPRQALSFRNLYESDYKPYYGELDVVGLVVHLEEGPGSFETVYLSNEESIIIGICFWGGLKAFTCEQLIKPKTLITASNLQWRSGTSVKWIPCIYVTELSTFSLHPRAIHLAEAQERFRKAIPKNLDEFASECQSKIMSLLKEKSRPKLPIESPTNEQLNSTIQRRIFKLEMYGEAPSLAPIGSNKLKKRRCGLSRKSDFRPPKRKLIPSSPPESPPLSPESSP